jgi:mannose-6-phosphate isomerase-like protein (cupin superfamily)
MKGEKGCPDDPKDITANFSNPDMKIINFSRAMAQIPDYWHPRIVSEVNDACVKLVKLKGEFVWHHHEAEDELFLVLKGTLTIRLRGETDLVLQPGEMVVIPRGVEHCPVAPEEVHVLLLEPKTTVNTGTTEGERTAAAEWLEEGG